MATDANVAVAGNVSERKAVTGVDSDQLTPEDVEHQQAERLPDRHAMSLVDANVAAPINAAAALNVLSDDSTAVADAQQTTEIQQSTD